MAVDQELLEILVCPKCRSELTAVEGGRGLLCDRCKLRYPVHDDIPHLIVEEAYDLARGGRAPEGPAVRLKRFSFRVTEGPDRNMAFHLEQGSCRAIGRAEADPNKTSVFNVDLALALDEGTKGLILHYIARQFRRVSREGGADALGGFRRAPDVILTDVSLSRLHDMLFAEESGVGILDLVSKNGTYVNGQEVESKMLAVGDVIEVGETKIVLEG